MSALPIQHVEGGQTAVVDPDSGEMVPLADASDRALAHAAAILAEYDKNTYAFRRAVAAELRDRHGVGKARAGGYEFTVAESQSWPLGATLAALGSVAFTGAITSADVERCVPNKPKPDGRQLKALIGRLTVTHPEAARQLADACTVSAPSLRDVHEATVDTSAEPTTTLVGQDE